MKRWQEYAIVVVLLAVFFGLGLHSYTQKSIANDELPHITAGYSYWKTGDFRLNPEHTPLIKLIAGFPLVLLDAKFPTEDPDWKAGNQWELGAKFIFHYNQNADQMLFWARFPMLLIGVLLGFYLYRWAKQLYGIQAGQLALVLFAFSPNILAHARLVTTDVGVTTFTFITFYYLWNYYQKKHKKYLYLSGLFFGLALAAKYTALYFIPIVGVVIAYEAYSKKKNLLGLFEKKIFLQQVYEFSVVMGIGVGILILSYGIVNFSYFFEGLKMVVSHGLEGHNAYFLGEFRQKGFLLYYPLVFLMKTPLATLALIGLTIIFARKIKKSNEHAYFLIVVGLFVLFTIINKINIGVRHILPIYPFLFLYCSKITKAKFKAKNIIIIVLVLFYIFSTVHAHPHYISYFNEVIGQENGYKYVVLHSVK